MAISPEAHAIIDKAAARSAERAKAYKTSLDYYEGRHPIPPATDRWTRQLQDAFQAIRDNLCPLVVEALVSRLKVSGFAPDMPELETAQPRREVIYQQGVPADVNQLVRQQAVANRRPPPGQKSGEAARRHAEELWSYNRMDGVQREVHEEAAKKGDAYVIVWPDPDGRASINPNDAELCDVEWNPDMPRRKLWAVKRWTDGDRVRVNIYYPDRIEKYVSVRAAKQVKAKSSPEEWEPFQPTRQEPELADDGIGEPIPTGRIIDVPLEPWPLDNPYGDVPVFHFRNRGKTGGYGKSELEEIAPLQDALNKEFQGLLLTSEQYGIPWRYIAGLRPEIDEETGKARPIDFKPLVDNILAVWGEGVSLGQFAAAELTQHVGVINDLRAEIGRLSQTPPHMLFLITGEIPSGEALKVVESPFTAKVEDRQTFWGNTWEDVISFACKVDAEAGTDVRYSVEWEDTQPTSLLEIAQTGEAWLRLGVPRRVVWKRLLDATDAECDEWEKLREDERAMDPLPPVAAPDGQGTIPGLEPPPSGPPPGYTPPQLAPYAQRTKAMVGERPPQGGQPRAGRNRPPDRRPARRR